MGQCEEHWTEHLLQVAFNSSCKCYWTISNIIFRISYSKYYITNCTKLIITMFERLKSLCNTLYCIKSPIRRIPWRGIGALNRISSQSIELLTKTS